MKNLKTILVSAFFICLFFLVIYTIADIMQPYIDGEGNYFSLNFGFKTATNRINAHKYHYLYNDCTNEYLIESGNSQYLKVWKDLYGGCWGLQSVLAEDATRFKDTTEAKRWLWIYYYYEHKKDSTMCSEGNKLMKEYEKENLERLKNRDVCKDTFKPLTK